MRFFFISLTRLGLSKQSQRKNILIDGSHMNNGNIYFSTVFFYYLCLWWLLALRFTVEPSNIVVSEGHSVLLPCEGEIADVNVGNVPVKRKSHKKRLDLLPDIRWRGPDGQDIGIVGDTFR